MQDSIRWVVLTAVAFGVSATVEAAGDPGKGQALYQSCVGCHGAAGEGNAALKSPRLAGQFDWYIAQQLRNFKSGVRGADPRDAGGKMMAPMAAVLGDDQAIEDVAAYIASMK